MPITARKRNLSVVALNVPAGEEPPREFRIFPAGKFSTTKGTYLFDDVAAEAVMARYHEHGVDIMLDLEHLSLDDESRAFDPDARGWCKLEMRSGELWAVDVTWTIDGAARLREKRQRYISPAFIVDEDTRRISAVLNVGITALPASHNIAPLIAASARAQKLSAFAEPSGDPIMTPEQFAGIAEVLGLGADANVEDVIATISAMVKKIEDAATGTTPEDAPADVPLAANVAATPPIAASIRLLAATRTLARLSGKKDIGQAIEEVEAWRKSHVELEGSRAKLAQDRAVLEGGERRRLVGELVRLGSEAPATAWADDTATNPAEPWASMEMVSLRARVAKLSAAKGNAPTTLGSKPNVPRGAPQSDEAGGKAITVRGEVVQLSASEVKACAENKADVEVYAANKLGRAQARAGVRR